MSSGVVDSIRSAITVDIGALSALVDGTTVTARSLLELRGLVASRVYERFHTGRTVQDGELPYNLRDPALEALIAEHVPHDEVQEDIIVGPPAPAGIKPPFEGGRLAVRSGVRVWVPTHVLGDRGPGETLTVSASPVRAALSPGYCVVLSSRRWAPTERLVRVYVHAHDPEQALPVWRELLGQLEENGIGYRAKMLSHPALYPRRDAIVVYLPLDDARAHDVAITAAVRSADGTLPADTSLFASRVAPGIALAEEPADPRPELGGLSFGQHRAALVARALVHAEGDAGGSDAERLAEEFAHANADLVRPWRNVDGPVLPDHESAAVLRSRDQAARPDRVSISR